jgi:hypothetical protein
VEKPWHVRPATSQVPRAVRHRGARQATVARQQSRIERLGKRDEDGVVGVQVLSKLPRPIEKWLMGVPLQTTGSWLDSLDATAYAVSVRRVD